MGKPLTNSEFKNRLLQSDAEVELLTEYTNARTPVKVRCKKCGNEYETLPQNLLRNHGCKKCGQVKALKTRREMPTERTIELYYELSEKHPNIIIPENLKTVNETFTAHCTICNNDWKTSLSRLTNIKGCPRCSRNSTSVTEQFIYETIKRALPDVEVINGIRKVIGKELDIYVPSLKKAIEFGGWYWHKDKIDSDIEKESECEKRGIRLLTIYEHVTDNPKQLPKNTVVLKDQVTTMQEMINISKLSLAFVSPDTDISSIDWEDVYETALSRIDRDAIIAHFKARAKTELPDIEVVGEYTRYKDPIRVKCRKCGYTWDSKPRYLFNSHGCPKCANAKRAENATKTSDDFAREISSLNPNLELVGAYEYSKNMVKLRCKKCGCVWQERADSALLQHKCPSCESSMHRGSVIKQSSQGHIKKKEVIVQKVAKLDKSIEIIGKVTSDTEPVTCKCKKCGTVFERTPKDLRRHPHCPKCNGHFRYTPETFRERMADINPKIEVIGDFKKQAEKLECKCKVCGHNWQVTPNKLLQGRGCPKCAQALRSKAGVEARKRKQKEAKE